MYSRVICVNDIFSRIIQKKKKTRNNHVRTGKEKKTNKAIDLLFAGTVCLVSTLRQRLYEM